MYKQFKYKLALFTLITLLAACSGGASNEDTQQQLQILSVQDRATVSDKSALPPSDESNGCTMSVLDQEMLDAINTARAEARWCGDTFYQAAPPVTWSCELDAAAHHHSDDMAANNFFSHTGSDGLRISNRVDAAGYGWTMVGENIAAGYTRTEDVMVGWLNSPGHCGTVMEENYQEMANALAIPQNADYASYWTLIMARPL